MKIRKLYSVTASLLFALSTVVSAHAGHGVDGDGESLHHYLTEPLHLGIGIAVIGIVAFLGYKLKQGKTKTVNEK